MAMRRYQKHLAKLKSRSHIHATVKKTEKMAMRALLKTFFGYAPCRPDERVPPIGAQDNNNDDDNHDDERQMLTCELRTSNQVQNGTAGWCGNTSNYK